MPNSNNYGPTVSRTLQANDTSMDLVVWQQGKPPLDSELNLMNDLGTEARRQALADQSPSGFLKIDPFVFNPTNPGGTANMFGMSPVKALVNGWFLRFNPSGTGMVTLPTAPTGLGNHRYDLVFLEVWKVLITGGATANKPSATELYKDGNVQNAAGNPPDDIKDVVVGIETTKRVQIQYRYRVQAGVPTPDGQNSNMYSALVLAQGATGAPVAGYTFTNMGSTLNDYGLWRAGNGDSASRTNLGTVDGYVYSIPIAVVFRRAIGTYSDGDTNGQNAVSTNIASGNSARPDGLFYDSVDASDVSDLRHLVMNQRAPGDILREAVRSMLSGMNASKLPTEIQYETISETGVPGYTNLNVDARADQVRTKWSDLQTTVVSYVAKLNVGDTNTNKDWHVINPSGGWDIGDSIVVNAPTDSPAGTIILGTNDALPATKPYVFFNTAALSPVNGIWTGLGTNSAIFTIASTVGLVNQEIWVVFDVQYPANQGLTNIPDQLLKLEYVNAGAFPIVQGSYTTYYGTVRNGTDLLSLDPRKSDGSKQIGFQHEGPVNNLATNYSLKKNNKEIEITPVIASVSGANRVMSTKNFHNSSKKVRLPLPTSRTWFVRGVYDAVTGGAELATITHVGIVLSVLNNAERTFSMPAAFPTSSFAEVTQLTYLPGPTNLIGNGPNDYQPVFRQSASGHVDKFILVKNSDGSILIPSAYSTTPSDYQVTFRRIPTANVNAYIVNDDSPDNNWITCQTAVADGAEVWLDIDYIGHPHDIAQLKIAYKYMPYQGLADGAGTNLVGNLKDMMGFIHSDGTSNTGDNINRTQYPRALVSYLPTPKDLDNALAGGSVAGPGPLGKYSSNPLCYVNDVKVLESSVPTGTALLPGMDVSARFNNLLALMEHGGNDSADNVNAMLQDLSGVTNKQAVIFGLASTKNNFSLQNELVLFAWTYTKNSLDNGFSSADITNLGADFFFIPGRPLVK